MMASVDPELVPGIEREAAERGISRGALLGELIRRARQKE
jgi:hypothetical protein